MIYVWLVLALIVAAVVALYQYDYISFNRLKTNSTTKKPWLAVLRFVTVFSILLLFIGLKFNTTTYLDIEPVLVVLSDDSKSIPYLKSEKEVRAINEFIRSDLELNKKFEIQNYSFDQQLYKQDSLRFSGTTTNLSLAIQESISLFEDRNKAVILLSDGNQTQGLDYSFLKLDEKTQLYPIIVGDTTQYPDVSITQVNANRYSYLNNEFPVEIFVNYQGDDAVTTNLQVVNNGKVVFKKNLSFSKIQKSEIVRFNVAATKIGLQNMRAVVQSIGNERNTDNNKRSIAVEVIDQQSKILLVSNSPHPDMGTLIKAIESNRQRKVDVATIKDYGDINDYNLIIPFHPDSSFKELFEKINTFSKNSWVIASAFSDFDVINSSQGAYRMEGTDETDQAQPILNKAYSNFNVDEIDLNDYPPVLTPFDETEFLQTTQVLLFKQIGNVETTIPLWFTYENGSRRHAVTLASGMWRWRSQSYLNNQSFENFDKIINSQVQYLSSNKRRQRLEVAYESFYYQNSKLLIAAQYLDKNYEFDDSGIINCTVTNIETKEKFTRPFILSNTTYKVDLSGLDAGDYEFTVSVENDQLSQRGRFSVLEFDIEKQFASANYKKFTTLLGKDNVYYQNQWELVKNRLLENPNYLSVQRANVSFTELIDWKYLLGIILALLSLEWLIRKYNGLI